MKPPSLTELNRARIAHEVTGGHLGSVARDIVGQYIVAYLMMGYDRMHCYMVNGCIWFTRELWEGGVQVGEETFYHDAPRDQEMKKVFALAQEYQEHLSQRLHYYRADGHTVNVEKLP